VAPKQFTKLVPKHVMKFARMTDIHLLLDSEAKLSNSLNILLKTMVNLLLKDSQEIKSKLQIGLNAIICTG